jgi:hypothetical protein
MIIDKKFEKIYMTFWHCARARFLPPARNWTVLCASSFRGRSSIERAAGTEYGTLVQLIREKILKRISKLLQGPAKY